MRRLAIAVAIGALSLSPLILEAQSRSAGTGGTGGRATGRPGQRGESAARQPAPLPNVRAVTSGTNPALELVDRKKKLKLDAETVTALEALAATMNERYAPLFARYDTLRTQANMARNQTKAAMGPTEEEQQIARERIAALRILMAEVRAQRAKDVDEALAAVPEDRREDARKALEEQAEELARSFRRSGAEGAAAAGPGGGAARRP